MRIGSLVVVVVGIAAGLATAARGEETRFIDLSLMVAPEYPCTWPEGFPTFRMETVASVGRDGDYNVDTLIIDGNTGTQLDVPAHSVARPELKLPHSSPMGNEFTEKVAAWKFCGEACVVDVPDLVEAGGKGTSALVKLDRVKQWEQKHRPAGAGDVVLFRSGYSDRFYRPLPEGRRFLADPLERKAIAWPDPDPETMDYLASHGVMHIGTDSPTMGAMPNLGEPIHFAALKYGAVLTEGATNLESLPKTGAFYCLLSPKHEGGPYGEARSFAIVGGDLPAWLIDAARKRQVADLSVTMSIDLPLTWPGAGAGRHRHRYTKTDFLWSDNLQLYHHGHIFDAHAGTHLVPPSYALPPEPLPATAAAPETRAWLEEFEKEFGPRGTSRVTTEQVPIAQTCGWMRVVDVRHLVGTVGRDRWPASPLVTVEELERFEVQHGPIKPGEIVVLRTGHTDRFFLPRAAGAACLADPVNGKSEGWPALDAKAIAWLAEKKVRCVATDAPTIGGVDPRAALRAYWMLGSRNMVAVEFLTNLGAVPEKAYLLFAAIKIRGCHGGPGRAIAVY